MDSTGVPQSRIRYSIPVPLLLPLDDAVLSSAAFSSFFNRNPKLCRQDDGMNGGSDFFFLFPLPSLLSGPP